MTKAKLTPQHVAPLAERLRPQVLAQFAGQTHLVGEGKPLATMIAQKQVPSLLLWGPPGTGKTTLARMIAREVDADFIQLSAIDAGVKDVRAAVARAEKNKALGTQTILFIDEVHRFNKAQQDAFLPSVENGTLTLIGATTENPSFSLNNALLSRCRTFVLDALGEQDIVAIIERALSDAQGYAGAVTMAPEDISYLAHMANGDARTALGALELAVQFAGDGHIARAEIDQALQKSNLLYDRNGDEHYNIISALHKSMRGGDADAALYWLARMLEGGEDSLYIARRVVRFASEDIGMANSFALPQATAAYDACRFIGMPECGVNLAQAVVYMAKSKKSIAVYAGYKEAMRDAREQGNLAVPLHLRNAPTKLMKELDYGKDYKYTPLATDEDNATQEFLPAELRGKKYLES